MFCKENTIQVLLYVIFATKKYKMNKKSIITALLFVVAAAAANAQFLFRISGNGLEKPSYMLGTIHSMPGSVLDSIPEYIEAEAQCEQLYPETDITDEQKNDELAYDYVKLSMDLLTTSTLPDEKNIFDLLSKEQSELLVDKMKQVAGISLTDPMMESLTSLQPVFYILMFNGFIQQEVRSKYGSKNDIQSALDATCIQRAKLRGIEVGQLDDKHFQDIFGRASVKIQELLSQSIDEQVDSLMSLVSNYDQRVQAAMDEGDALYQVIEYWREADFESFVAMRYYQSAVNAAPSIFKDRNVKWLPKMQEAMKKAPTMFCFGAAHLLGEHGIIQLLNDAGYKVEQVKIKVDE